MVNAVKITSALVIRVKADDKNGKEVFKSITLKKLKTSAVVADVHAVGMAIAGVLNLPVDAIQRQNLDELLDA